MEITINHKGNFLLEGKNDRGNTVLMDVAQQLGGDGKGASPMQVLLMSLGGCSAIDIIMILKKQKQQIDDFNISVKGEREEVKDGAAIFKNIHIIYSLKGPVDEGKLLRAVDLSVNKYCSVYMILQKSANITHSVMLNEKEISLK